MRYFLVMMMFLAPFSHSSAHADEWAQVAIKDSNDDTIFVRSVPNAQAKTYPLVATFDTATVTLNRTVVSGKVTYCVTFKADAGYPANNVCHVLNLTTLNASVINGHVVGLMTGDDSGTPPPPAGVGGITTNDPYSAMSVDGDSDEGTKSCKCCLYDENDNKTCDSQTCDEQDPCRVDTTSGAPVASCQ